LFIERATAVQPTFALMHENASAVAHICQRLDGIPLALELAAARMKLFAPAQIVSRLDDRFRLLTGGSRAALPRQQTLRATIDWSDSLLSDAERMLFRRLSVFAGGWTFDAAEAVCVSDGLDAFEMLDLLAQLVNKSLVTTEAREGETRYRMLDTIRDYALDKLDAAGEAEQVRDRHLEYFLALAETAEPQLRSREQSAWVHRLETELDNVRGALDWCMQQPARAGVGLRLVGILAWFWELRGYLNEGRQRVATALAHASGAVHLAWRAQALNAAGRLAFVQDDLETAQVQLEESVELADRVSDQWLMLTARHNLANVLALRGEHEAARALHATSLELGKAIGDPWGMAWALMGLGRAALARGEYDAARAYFEESLVLRRGMHDQWGIARSLKELGDVARLQGDYGTARARYAASLAIHQALGQTGFMMRVLPDLAYVVHQLGADDEAAVLFTQGLQLAQALGRRYGLGVCLVGLATIASARGQPDKASQLLAASERLIASTRLVWSPYALVAVEQLKQVLHAALGADSYAIAWDKGGALTQEQAVALALQEGS
jgi:tetratricopeptide (TPR) repeat protein